MVLSDRKLASILQTSLVRPDRYVICGVGRRGLCPLVSMVTRVLHIITPRVGVIRAQAAGVAVSRCDVAQRVHVGPTVAVRVGG